MFSVDGSFIVIPKQHLVIAVNLRRNHIHRLMLVCGAHNSVPLDLLRQKGTDHFRSIHTHNGIHVFCLWNSRIQYMCRLFCFRHTCLDTCHIHIIINVGMTRCKMSVHGMQRQHVAFF